MRTKAGPAGVVGEAGCGLAVVMAHLAARELDGDKYRGGRRVAPTRFVQIRSGNQFADEEFGFDVGEVFDVAN